MAKVHVIARFVAREGSENQLGALLQGQVGSYAIRIGM
jgi:hypothetical protein